MSKKKLIRAARHFANKASLEQSNAKNAGYNLYRAGKLNEAANVNAQIDELEDVIDGLYTLIEHLDGTGAIPARKISDRTRAELIRHLADLYLDDRDRDAQAASQVLVARRYVKEIGAHQSQTTDAGVSIFMTEQDM